MGIRGGVLVKSSRKIFVKYTRTERSQSQDNMKKNILGRRNSKCEDPETGTDLVYSRKKTKGQEEVSKIGKSDES